MNIQMILDKVDELFQYQQLDLVEPYLLECLEVALKNEDNEMINAIVSELVGYYRSINQHERALQFGKLALKLLNDERHYHTLYYARTLINYATALRASSNPSESLYYYQQAHIILNEYPLEMMQDDMSALLNNQGLAYFSLNQFNQAINNFKEAIQLLNDDVSKAKSLLNMADCYEALQDNIEALNCCEKALKLLNDKGHRYYYLGVFKKAKLHEKMNEYGIAQQYYQEALDVYYWHFGIDDTFKQLTEYGNNTERYYNQFPKNGMELSKLYFEKTKHLFEKSFPNIYHQLAFGFVGEGSECFGFDDELSRDHDFGAGYCVFVPEYLKDYQKELEACYEKLPKVFLGFKRNDTHHRRYQVGVIIIEKFFEYFTGYKQGPQTLDEWYHVDENRMACVTNGEIFEDQSQYFTTIYQSLKNHYPSLIYDEKVAEVLIEMAKTGQYQYQRCLKRKDMYSAKLFLYQFIQATMQYVYLNNQIYMPYAKWVFKKAESFQYNQDIIALIKAIIDDDGTNQTHRIERICELIVEELDLDCNDTYLETQAIKLLEWRKEYVG